MSPNDQRNNNTNPHYKEFTEQELADQKGGLDLLSATSIDPHCQTFHVSRPKKIYLGSSSCQAAYDSQDSLDETIAVSRRHIVIHGLDCSLDMKCEERNKECPSQPPGVSAAVLGIPRAHVVTSLTTPERYNLEMMWSRPLSCGPLVAVGDRIWIDGLGEVILGDSRMADVSPHWGFFSAPTWAHGVIELAVEWKYIQLSMEEFEQRSLLGGPNVRVEHRIKDLVEDPIADQGLMVGEGSFGSFLDLEEDEGWWGRWAGWWKRALSHVTLYFVARDTGSAA